MYYYRQYLQHAVIAELSLSWEAGVGECASAFISFIFLIYFTAFVEGAAIKMWEELQVSARKQELERSGRSQKNCNPFFFFNLTH